jgi:phosphate transport system substrate-binding protein
VNRRGACIAIGAGALTGGACARRPGAPDRHERTRQALLIGAAAPLLPLVKALAAGFLQRHADVVSTVLVEPGASLPAYIAASRGAIDMAAMTRALSDAEDGAGARHYLLARDEIGILVHPALPLRTLAQAQVRALLDGTIANWRALGGPDLPVTVLAPPRAGGMRQDAERLLLDGGEFAVNARECAAAAALLEALRATPGAIGCLDGRSRALVAADGAAMPAIDGVPAARETVLSGRYPYVQSFYLLLHGAPDGVSAAFLRFARGAAGQALVRAHGLVAVC